MSVRKKKYEFSFELADGVFLTEAEIVEESKFIEETINKGLLSKFQLALERIESRYLKTTNSGSDEKNSENVEGMISYTSEMYTSLSPDKSVTLVFVVHLSFDLPLIASYDFSVSNELTDALLVIEGCHFHVSKGYLANLSPFFQWLFFANADESAEQNEFHFSDENADDFQQFFEVVYHKSEITAKNVDTIIKLSQRCKMFDLMQRCEEAIINFPYREMDKKEKIRLADEYRMQSLMDYCMNRIKTAHDAKQISPEYIDQLRPETRKRLLRRALEVESNYKRKRRRTR